MKQVKSVRHFGGHKLQLTFSDASVRSVDLADRIERLAKHPESIFKELLDIEYFSFSLRVNHWLHAPYTHCPPGPSRLAT